VEYVAMSDSSIWLHVLLDAVNIPHSYPSVMKVQSPLSFSIVLPTQFTALALTDTKTNINPPHYIKKRHPLDMHSSPLPSPFSYSQQTSPVPGDPLVGNRSSAIIWSMSLPVLLGPKYRSRTSDRLTPNASLTASGNILDGDDDLVSSLTGTREGTTSTGSTDGAVT
jgi:hypothetical protein